MAASLPFTASYFPNRLHTPKISASFRSTCISPTKFFNLKLSIRYSPCRRFDSSIQGKPQKICCSNEKNKNSVPVPDRLLAAVGYFLPFFDVVQYGRFFLRDFPSAQLLLQPLSPAIRVYKSYPYASILVLFILYFYVVPNPNIRRYVRFNVMQAVALDVLLTGADIVDHAFGPQNDGGFSLLTSFESSVFLFLLTCLIYGATSCLMGQVARLPLVADAAETQVLVFWIAYLVLTSVWPGCLDVDKEESAESVGQESINLHRSHNGRKIAKNEWLQDCITGKGKLDNLT